MSGSKLVHAESCPGELTTAQVNRWRDEGYALVSGLMPPELISAIQQAADEKFPGPGSDAAGDIADFGSNVNFPTQIAALNQITLYEPLLDAVAALLGVATEEIRLTQSDLWPKYGHTQKKGVQDNQDQRIHVDYPNHMLAHPAPWDRPEAVEIIIYFDDVEETGGSTAVVPRQGKDDACYRWPIVDTPGIGDLRYINDRTSAEAYFAEERPHLAAFRESLYEREVHTGFKPGDVLFYRHDTWHRGTPMKAGTRRIVLNMTYRKASAEWISTLHVGWAWKAYRDNKFLERLIAGASLKQRAVMGFPQPGAEYWCEETIEAVTARYGMFGFDPAPYRDALRGA